MYNPPACGAVGTRADMKVKRKLAEELLEALRQSMGLRIRAGNEHRFTGIWHVVVDERVFVRSWSVKEKGWYRTFLKVPNGAILVGKEEIEIAAKPVRGAKLRNSIDRAYLEKYKSPGAVRYAKDLGSAKSRATMMELVASRGKNGSRYHVKSSR
jgi:hypothetical protein